MIIDIKEINYKENDRLHIARNKQVKKYMEKEGLPIETMHYSLDASKTPANELIIIDMSKINSKQHRHIKRILSGKYDD